MEDHYRNHHTLLQYRVAQIGASPIFKIPIVDGPEPPTRWTDVSFSQFASEVNVVARYLAAQFEEKGVPVGSIVAVWFSGLEYAHFVYIVALSRASYVPQVFSDGLANAGMVFELMRESGAKAIIHDPSFESLMADCPFAMLPTVPISDCSKAGVVFQSVLPKAEDLPSDKEAICFIFHTSGSTARSPKLVPFTHKFIRTIYSKSDSTWHQGGPFDTREVHTQLGSACLGATMSQYLVMLHVGGCIIQPSSLRFSTMELSSMVEVCGLNRLSAYASLLIPHIDAARKDVAVLKLLQDLRSLGYGGLALPSEVENWSHENHIPLVNGYASTECGVMMSSVLGHHASLLKPHPLISYRIDHVGETTQIDSTDSKPLYEFVVLSNSPDLPQPHLLSPDGNYRTGDLFEQAGDGYYIFRGRDDDWIKNDMTKRCDTKAIEDQVRATCGDLVRNCVVVGNGRPSPALFIERLAAIVYDDEHLKDIVLGRMKQFNERRYTHERVTDPRLIFIVLQGMLPRTAKGNFRRKAVEQSYQQQLDSVYASL